MKGTAAIQSQADPRRRAVTPEWSAMARLRALARHLALSGLQAEAAAVANVADDLAARRTGLEWALADAIALIGTDP